MRLLALDTATEGCSAACLAGESLVERYQIEPQGHSRLLLTMVTGWHAILTPVFAACCTLLWALSAGVVIIIEMFFSSQMKFLISCVFFVPCMKSA